MIRSLDAEPGAGLGQRQVYRRAGAACQDASNGSGVTPVDIRESAHENLPIS
jgi:hypothetical protein